MATFNSYKKRREAIIIGPESAPGTTATKQYAVRWLDKGLKPVPGIIENESAMGNDIRVNDSAIDVWHSEGPLGGKVTPDLYGWLQTGLYNKTTTTGTGPTYTHVLSRDLTLARRSFSIWDVRPHGTRLYKSCYIDNLETKIEVGESGAWLEVAGAFKGWKHTDIAAGTVTPIFKVGELEFTSRQVEVFIADNVAGLAAGKVRPKSITITQGEPVTVDHYVGETDNDPEFDSAPVEAKCSMVVKYKSDTFDTALASNAIKAVRIVASNGDESITWLATKARIRELTDSDGRDDTVTQEISWYFEADETNGGKDMEVTVVNSVSSLSA